jgi:pyruvate kinase
MPSAIDRPATSRPTAESERRLLAELVALREAVAAEGQATGASWRLHVRRREFLPSAENLAAYVALRRRDLRGLQERLMPLGLSSLGRSEARVMPNLDAVIATLARLAGADAQPDHPLPAEYARGSRLLARNTAAVFGAAPSNRQVRIMVTLPSRAAEDFDLVRGLVAGGMDVARINCSHDDAAAWEAMAAHVRRAVAETGRPCRISMDLCGPRARTGHLSGGSKEERLAVGDGFLLVRGDPGRAETALLEVECSLPEIIDQLVPGSAVCVDEGRLRATVESVTAAGALLRVTQAGEKGGKIKPDKGLNFPDTELRLSPLTERDLRALDVVVRIADIVGYSFVQRREDVELLQAELAGRCDDPARLAILAKIETAAAIRNLPEIIVQAAGAQPLAVMIARGDLAVEIGYPRLAEIQEELLWLCEAAHTPVVWATQVLDTFVRKGVHSRAEMTDVAMAERAECVMLNKGPYVQDAVTVLDDVLGRMEGHQTKKTARMRALHSW